MNTFWAVKLYEAAKFERVNDILILSIRYQKNAKAAEDVEYPAYGVTGSGRDVSPTSADRKLAQNAQLYHYQHQKQQMMAFDS